MSENNFENNFKRVTRADVAKLAGVSETVVSYVINNNRYVSEDKRKRVEEAIKQLNYRPNYIARALKGKSSNHIIFIADQITNEHFSQLISQMDEYAYNNGYLISLCQNRNTEEFVSHIISRQYDGIIISSTSFPEAYIKRFISSNIPVVLLKNRDYTDVDGAGLINTGLYEGARQCVRHLVERGRKHILYLDRISAQGRFSDESDLRYRGFADQMKDCNLDFSEKNIITGCSDESQVIEKIKDRINQGFPVDGIFGRNDRLAVIGMHAVRQLGYKIPEDISVIGFDNSSLSKYTNPSLSTVEIPRKEIGKAAVQMLHQMINEATLPEQLNFTTKLIVRESS
ncbi:MAG: LacI family transcriptional regulator [Clostridiaceae bacterium]|nr:LacI family transcriptional regulator [Clostridiaceae bacterium]